MDDLTFTARRATAIARVETDVDIEGRFRNLVQSPLRAGLLRYISSRPEETFDVESLMQAFGRLRLDVETPSKNCLISASSESFPAILSSTRPSRPDDPTLVRLLDKFLERRATIGTRTSPRPFSASAK